jgi:hypothetical protein
MATGEPTPKRSSTAELDARRSPAAAPCDDLAERRDEGRTRGSRDHDARRSRPWYVPFAHEMSVVLFGEGLMLAARHGSPEFGWRVRNHGGAAAVAVVSLCLASCSIDRVTFLSKPPVALVVSVTELAVLEGGADVVHGGAEREALR